MGATRVAVGMSGGVDSSTAAAILVRSGLEVVGVTMRTWNREVLAGAATTAHGCYGPSEAEDIADARRVADALGIPLVEVNLAEEYGRTVLDYVRTEYAAGRTPNPCVRCNPRMKFGLLWDKMQELGLAADVFATGHYVRITTDAVTGRVALRKAADAAKDQSYFLAFLSQEQLSRVMFPLGDLSKTEVRSLARQWGLPVSDKRESQDFAEGGAAALLGLAEEPGPILDQAGTVLGEHRGIAHYTVGQRRGLRLPAPERLYVLRIEAAQNQLVVGPRDELQQRTLVASGLNWVAVEPPTEPWRAKAKIRSQHAEAEARLVPLGTDRLQVEFDTPQFGIAPGQAVVFYRDDLVLGAGIIQP